MPLPLLCENSHFHPHISNTLSNEARMNSSLCVCVCALLVSLSVTSLARPHQDQGNTLPSQMGPSLSDGDSRVARSDTMGNLAKAYGMADEDAANSRANLSELLARLISRKGSVRRNSAVNSKALSDNHRIKDRDYLGWMDFGRRSAEEYEYSS